MDPDEAGFVVDEVEALACRFEPVPWRFATEQAGAIAVHWAAACRERPRLFDGRVLMQTEGALDRSPEGRRLFRACYTDVDFAAFLAWRDFGFPASGVRNGFGMAALQGADGAFVLGEMGAHTANAGRVYFPSGTPDRDDIRPDAVVDLEGSIARELAEETGLDPGALVTAPGFTVIHDAARVCIVQRLRATQTAEALAARIMATLAAQPLPEFVRMHVVRSVADITPAMPPFVALYLRRAFASPQPG